MKNLGDSSSILATKNNYPQRFCCKTLASQSKRALSNLISKNDIMGEMNPHLSFILLTSFSNPFTFLLTFLPFLTLLKILK